MIELNCEVCAAPFKVKPYRATTARFCSFECGGKWHMANRQMPNGHKVGNTWRKGLRPANAFAIGNTPANKLAGITFACEQCRTDFTMKPWLVRQNTTKSGNRFCSKACYAAFKQERQSGPNAPDYVGGITTYRGKGWIQARAAAVTRDDGTCQECGRVIGESIPVHHIRPFREFSTADEANALGNLICLCQSCHMKIEHQTTSLKKR